MKTQPWLLSPLWSFFIVSLALGQTYPTHIRYQPGREFPSLRRKIGSTLGIAPFKDDRADKPYVGHQTAIRVASRRRSTQSLQSSTYFKSEPFPLKKAIIDSLSEAVSRSGVKVIPLSDWDRKPESLKNAAADSILMIEIKSFWTEGIAEALGTKLITSIYLVMYLGVKKEGKVITRYVYVTKEDKVAVLTPAEVEQILNRNLSRTLDDFLSNPY